MVHHVRVAFLAAAERPAFCAMAHPTKLLLSYVIMVGRLQSSPCSSPRSRTVKVFVGKLPTPLGFATGFWTVWVLDFAHTPNPYRIQPVRPCPPVLPDTAQRAVWSRSSATSPPPKARHIAKLVR